MPSRNRFAPRYARASGGSRPPSCTPRCRTCRSRVGEWTGYSIDRLTLARRPQARRSATREWFQTSQRADTRHGDIAMHVANASFSQRPFHQRCTRPRPHIQNPPPPRRDGLAKSTLACVEVRGLPERRPRYGCSQVLLAPCAKSAARGSTSRPGRMPNLGEPLSEWAPTPTRRSSGPSPADARRSWARRLRRRDRSVRYGRSERTRYVDSHRVAKLSVRGRLPRSVDLRPFDTAIDGDSTST